MKALFNREVFGQFIRDMSEAVKAVRTDCLFYINMGLHYDSRDIIPAQDLLGAEGGFGYYGPPRETKHWKVGLTSRVLEGLAEGKPTVNFICADFKCWDRYLKPSADLMRQAASALANGSNYWLGLHSSERELRKPEFGKVAELNRIVAANPGIYAGTCVCARGALLEFSEPRTETSRRSL